MGNQPDLDQLLKRQNRVITRQQALACGLPHTSVHHRLRPGGPWRLMLPGVYIAVTGTPTTDQRETAALLYAGRGSTLTGAAALRRHCVPVRSDTIDVLVPAERQRRSARFVVIHRTTRLPPLVCYAGPVQYALPARAVADAARAMGDLGDVRAVVGSAVQRRACTLEQLEAELQAGPRRGSALLRAALAEVTLGARSGPEAALVALIRRGRLPMPMFNPLLYAGTDLLARPDAWWPDHAVVVEVDSKQWHLSPHDWEQTMRRHARLSALGILVLHFTPRQIRDEPDQVIATIRAALASRRDHAALLQGIRAVPAC